MPPLLSCDSLSKRFRNHVLFSDLSIGFGSDEKTGLIGPNGSGKTTLLRLLAGLEIPDSGAVSLRRGVRLGYLPQEDLFDPDLTVEQVLMEAIARDPGDTYEKLPRVTDALRRAGFSEPDQKTQALSGGGQKRLAIARLLIQEPDLLLMDEPTNHLDLAGIFWLENLLSTTSLAFVVVSHDRYFLENISTRTLEINRSYPDGYLSAPGPYSTFLLRREEFLASQAHQEVSLASKTRREIEWLMRGARARTTKSIHRIHTTGQMIQDLAELRSRNTQDRPIGLDFEATHRRTKELLVGTNLSKELGGNLLFHNLSLVLSPGTRIGLVGPNGSGKTTLIRILIGELSPDSGKVKAANGLRVVVYNQGRETLDRTISLRDALSSEGDWVTYQGRRTHVSAWAKRFLFTPDQLEVPVSELSGGEQARILLARLMLQPADLLVLDEPTNDLDIPSLEVLEETLSDFPGAVLLVTHDRFMMDQLSTEILALNGRGEFAFFAGYEQWEERWGTSVELPSKPISTPISKGAKPQSSTPTHIFTMKDQKLLDGIETKILKAEQEMEVLIQSMNNPDLSADYMRLQEIADAVQTIQTRIESYYNRWQELEEKKARVGK